MTSNGKRRPPLKNSTNLPALDTVSTLSLGLQGLGLKELITEEDVAARDKEDVVMMDGELEGAVDFEDISELAEEEDQMSVSDGDHMSDGKEMEEDWEFHSGSVIGDGRVEMDETADFLAKKSRVKFTEVMTLGTLKKTDSLPRTKPVKSHKGPLLHLPDQVDAFLSWQAGPFPEKRSNKQRLILAAEVKKATRVVKTIAALERAKETLPQLPPTEPDHLAASSKKPKEFTCGEATCSR